MLTLTLESEYVDMLKPFGQVEEVLKEIIRRYAREQIPQRIKNVQQEIKSYEVKYGLPYDQFFEQVMNNESFVADLWAINPTWKVDLSAWEYDLEVLAEWQQHLAKLSNN